MIGPLVLAADPQTNLQAATKNYVDMLFAVGLPPGGPFLPLAGNATVWGPTTFSAPGTALSVTNNANVGAALLLGGSPSFYSMAQSGAVGDGVTDDQPAIQAWLNTLTAGAEVILPPGKWYYIHAAPLVIPPNIAIRGSYNTKDNNTVRSGTLFKAGGFYIDPALPIGIVMGNATSLKQTKVFRVGLTVNASNTQAMNDYATWAAEGVYIQTNGAISNGATTIPLTSTTGVTVGMQVLGPGALSPGGGGGPYSPVTVTAINAGVSVTISSGVIGAQASGIWYRFGASLGIALPRSSTGIVLEDLVVVGFRTGIITFPGQFHITRCTGDCITNLECVGGADYAVTRDCEWMPIYGMTPATGFVRAGDMVFYHDCSGPSFSNCFGIGWVTGWHFENATVACQNCSNEVPNTAGAGTVNWFLKGGSSVTLLDCHAQAGSIGFLIDGVNYHYLSDCTSYGYQTTAANNTAHFVVQNTGGTGMYGSIKNPQTYGGYTSGKVPFKWGSGTISGCELTNLSMMDLPSTPTVPFMSGSMPLKMVQNQSQGMAYLGSRGTGLTSTILWYWTGLIFDGAATIATHTIVLPAYPSDLQTLAIIFNIAVTTLTISTTDGATVGAYPNPTAGKELRLVYVASLNKWFVGG